jgi:tetratricopeptide (TPR) repeat protein
VDRAIEHLTQAIALAPADLSAHQGRLHVAINSARTPKAPVLLGDSLARYPGPNAIEDWLSYAQELWEMHAPDVGLEYMRVLEKYYPNDHRVAGNVGTFLIALKRDDEGLTYLRRAVALAPDDAIDNWNLGRFQDKHGDPTSAETFYRKAVSLEKDPERRQDMACNLGRFLTARPATRPEGCALADKACGGRIPECGGTPPP